jgi:muramidase (phage lysozyme)
MKNLIIPEIHLQGRRELLAEKIENKKYTPLQRKAFKDELRWVNQTIKSFKENEFNFND